MAPFEHHFHRAFQVNQACVPASASSCSVAMNWCCDSNGMASTRGRRVFTASPSRPALRAATINATSVGSPCASQRPSFWTSALSLHSSPASRHSDSARRLARGEPPVRPSDEVAARLVALPPHVAARRRRPRPASHGHLVSRERAGLVRADHRGAAERFDGGQLADDGAAPGHARHADGQRDGDGSGQALRDRAHRQRDGGGENVVAGVRRGPTRGPRPPGQAEDQDQQFLSKGADLARQRCFQACAAAESHFRDAPDLPC